MKQWCVQRSLADGAAWGRALRRAAAATSPIAAVLWCGCPIAAVLWCLPESACAMVARNFWFTATPALKMFHVKHSFISILRQSTASTLSDAQYQLLEDHWRLVLAWNERVNLTAIRDDIESAWLHYADSLAGLPHLRPGSIVDLGSGAGYPGIPLAIASPERPVLLVEPRQKRTSFLDVSATRLGLKTVRTYVGRSEDKPPEQFANVVTRATFSDEGDLKHCLRWLAPGGRLIAWRADDLASSATNVVRYELNGKTHALHIWDT